ncbi:hypothetical protein AB0M32_36205 [Streptomyces sp. NPDC051985]|uniref:hypothetical protein n=1 Tax=Streptomyces sp. NPDC051985 TaxID=3155807 RepID=UPI0034362B97
MTTKTASGRVPFITLRRGEEAAPANFFVTGAPGRRRLHYRDEDPRDRDAHGVLWARCSLNPVDDLKRPTGTPEWKLMHPFRQRITMGALHCQDCAAPARTPLGHVFLAGPNFTVPDQGPLLTGQPPVCAKHIQSSARLCPHLGGGPKVFVVRSAPLYGVIGTLYGYREGVIKVVAESDVPLPYGHPNLPMFLASQLVRRLSSYEITTVDRLMADLTKAP